MREVNLTSQGFPEVASYDSEELEQGEIREDDPPTSEKHIHKGRLASTIEVSSSECKTIEEHANVRQSTLFEKSSHQGRLARAIDVRSSDCEAIEKGYANLRRSTSLEKGFHKGMLASTIEVRPSDYEAIENGHVNIRQSTLLETSSAKGLMHQNVSSAVYNRPKERHQRKQHSYSKYSEYHQHVDLCNDKILKKIDKICSERLDQLLLWQKEALQDFKILKKKQELELLQEHHMESYKVCAMHVIPIVRDYRTKLPKQQFSILRERFDKHVQSQLRKFVVQQIKDRNREKKIKECWIEKAKAGILEKYFNEIPLSDSGFKMKKFKKQLADSSEDEEPLKSFDMQCLNTELEAIVSTREPEDILTPKRSAVSESILTNSVQLPETNASVANLGFSVGVAGDMPSVVECRSSQSTCANALEFYEKLGPCFTCSAVALHEEENMGEISASQSVRDAALKNSKVVTANSENTSISREQRRGIGSDRDVSEGSRSQSQKEIPSDSVSKSSKTACSKKPPSARLPSVENGRMNQAENTGIMQTPYNQTAYSSQVTELSNMHGQMSTVTHDAQQLQRDNSTCRSAAYPYAPPSGNTHSARTRLDCLGASNVQVDPVNKVPTSCTVQQFLPENGSQSNPVTSELTRLGTLRDLIAKRHEEKREQLILACEIEISQAKRKYAELIHNSELEVLQSKKNLKIICDKIYKHQILAEGFRGIFKAAAGVDSNGLKGSAKSTIAQSAQLSQWQVSQWPASIPIPASAAMCTLSQPSAQGCSLRQTNVTSEQLAVASLSRSITTSMHPANGGMRTGATYRAPAPHLRAFVSPLAASNLHRGLTSIEK